MKHRQRTVLFSAAAAAAVAMSLMAAPAVSADAPDTVTTLNPYNNPNVGYLSAASCLLNLSSTPDFTFVTTFTQCGQTITFTGSPQKLSIPASWPSPWGNNPTQVEIGNPDVLFTTTGVTTLNIAFSSPRRIAGFEASPQLGAVQSFKADYFDAAGNLIGTVSRNISGGKARLIAAKTQPSTKVLNIRITSNGDFAIGRLRWKP